MRVCAERRSLSVFECATYVWGTCRSSATHTKGEERGWRENKKDLASQDLFKFCSFLPFPFFLSVYNLVSKVTRYEHCSYLERWVYLSDVRSETSGGAEVERTMRRVLESGNVYYRQLILKTTEQDHSSVKGGNGMCVEWKRMLFRSSIP